MEERFHALTLLLLRKQRLKLDELQEELKITKETLYSFLAELPVLLEGDEVLVVDTAGLLLDLWKRRFDPVELALSTGWKDFEKLCSRILEEYGFETFLNVRLKVLEKVRELDVVALREPWVLAVDCKRWARRRESHLRLAARAHKARCELLARELPKVVEVAARVASWREAKVGPAIVDVHETVMKVFEGVPIIPLRKLPAFLDEFEAFADELYVVKVALR
ncbi:MAG: hypothetical protein QW407_01190 [Thermofilaceae archaeon]